VTSIDWKGNNGWVTLTLPEVTFIATAVANHVRDCFTKEKELLERINILDTLQELQMFNVEQEWNS
jgi:hypothetical protein